MASLAINYLPVNPSAASSEPPGRRRQESGGWVRTGGEKDGYRSYRALETFATSRESGERAGGQRNK